MGYLTPPPSPAPVIVYKDVGGLVTEYESQTEIYRRDGREVRLHECRSACTLALSLPNVCVYPDSLLKFHQAYNATNRATDLGVSAQLFASYPTAVQGRLGYLTRQYKVLTGAELIALGVRNCNGDDRIMIAAAKPPAPPRAEPNPLSEIAQTVQSAVAKALGRLETAPQEPIRVAVADRKPVPPALAQLNGRATAATGMAPSGWLGETRIDATYGEAPLPPRRPPSIAVTFADAPSRYMQLIRGAQPIMSEQQFKPYASASLE